MERQACIALPKNGAFAGVVDEDESLLAGAPRGGEEKRFDTESREFATVQSCGAVVAHLADVASLQSPGLAGDHGGGDLSTGQDVGGVKGDLGSGGGIFGERN